MLHFNDTQSSKLLTLNLFGDTNTSSVELGPWLSFAFTLYFIGILGIVFNYKNFLITMMSVELMYLGAITNFVMHGTLTETPVGSVFGLLFLILAACESAIGLGIIVVLYRFAESIDFTDYQQLGG